MSLPLAFLESLQEKTDEQLRDILAHPNDYVPEALGVVREELSQRNLKREQRRIAALGVSKSRRQVRSEARLVDRIKTLEVEARGRALWREEYENRANHEEEEVTAYELHSSRYERIVKEIHRLAHPQWILKLIAKGFK